MDHWSLEDGDDGGCCGPPRQTWFQGFLSSWMTPPFQPGPYQGNLKSCHFMLWKQCRNWEELWHLVLPIRPSRYSTCKAHLDEDSTRWQNTRRSKVGSQEEGRWEEGTDSFRRQTPSLFWQGARRRDQNPWADSSKMVAKRKTRDSQLRKVSTATNKQANK